MVPRILIKVERDSQRMEKIQVLAEKSIRAFRVGGIKEFFRRVQFYFRRKRDLKRESKIQVENCENPAGKYYMDVLFINGCYLPHPSRYRVTHQREQLLAGNLTSNEVFYTDLTLELVRNYRVFIFYRCPYTETVGKFIQLAKKYHKTVLFDLDDLVIDRKYTDLVPYVREMEKKDKKVYDEGVMLIRKTLCLCDGAITTTERMAEELKHYVSEVYINRNVVSDRMLQLSEWASYDRDILPYKKKGEIKGKEEWKIYKKACKKKKEREKGGIRLGYFSGSITHNDDFYLILPIIKRVMGQYKDLELWIIGELDIPEQLQCYKERIISHAFVDWTELPRLIASVDINLAPLEQTIFNEAKSENKWVEAALVKVPTIASKLGAFKKMIQSGITGVLCETEKEWEEELTSLIEKKVYREKIGKNAYEYVKKHCVSIYTAYGITNYIKKKMNPNIIFVLPTLQISGGFLVVLKHCELLKQFGLDVTIFNDGYEKNLYVKTDYDLIPVISRKEIGIYGSIDKAVATLYSTVEFLTLYPNIKERFYFVQNFETDFYQAGEYLRFRANQTYFSCVTMRYITISRWCQKWLKEQYGKEAFYAPNGIEITRFQPKKRKMDGKIRIIVEGNSEDYYKNVDESFKIINMLEKEKYEVWYMSYQGKPKDWYRIDKFLHKVPNKEVAKIYRQCDILIKSSILESFSYPPLEMMATGGFVVVAPNEGNIEYLKDGVNCLFYKHEDLQTAVQAIENIISHSELRETLYKEGLLTAEKRNWEFIKEDIVNIYI